jgi:hypothetical protein
MLFFCRSLFREKYYKRVAIVDAETLYNEMMDTIRDDIELIHRSPEPL